MWCYRAALLLFVAICVTGKEQELLTLTVATERNDALDRFLRSANINGFEVQILGAGAQWKGGDVARTVGGGQKVKLLRSELEKYKTRDDLLVLFVDSYDVLFLNEKEKLLEAYRNLNAKVIFGAEHFCWPQQSLEKLYPPTKSGEKMFLNSGAFIGPASSLYRIVSFTNIKDDDDDQLYYTNIFLNEDLRKELNIILDDSSKIFQNLHGALDEVEVRFEDKTGYIYNTKTSTRPIVLHGNGPIKVEFNTLSNYLVHTWTPTAGCQQCDETAIELNDPAEYPVVQMSIFVETPTPFFDLFFERIAALSYPKSRIHLTGHVSKSAAFQKKIADQFAEKHRQQYRSMTWFNPEEVKTEGDARHRALAQCLATEDCQFLFSVDSIAQLTETDTLEHLVRTNRSILAPMMTRREKLWSNFWGALSKSGYYARSDDYVEIIEGTKKGIWNVPFVRDVYLLSRTAVQTLVEAQLKTVNEVDMELCNYARKKNLFMLVDNRRPFGYLINAENHTSDHLHNDLWQIFENPLDWEEQYVHKDYFKLAAPTVTMTDVAQPCPDVFWFPLLTEKFCRQLIEEMEHFGQWSDGTNVDPRLEGGYENVPTRDIHMRQVEWEDHWIHFMRKYVHPMQMKLFQGYDDKPWARMNFVVRYRPDEQPSLRPHHDASSYTLNIALNRPGVDYQGGGIRFVRYNCSVTETKVGWVIVNPGRVTHLHEGLTTLSGTRYIFITFVNP